MTGSPRWPARSTCTWSPTTRWPARRVPGRPRVAALAAPVRCSAGSRAVLLPVVLTVVLHPFAGTGPAAAGRGAVPRRGRPGGPGRRPAARPCSGRSSASCCSTGSSPRRSGDSLSPSRRTWWPCSSSSPSRSRSPPWSTGRRGGPPRPPGRAPRRPRWAGCPGRCSPGRTRPRRSWSGCARRSGRTPSSCSTRGPTGWQVVAASGDRARRHPTRATPGSEWTTTTCSRCAGEPLRATDQRVLEAFAVQTGLVLEYRRLRAREDRAAALERPRRRRPRCCARSRTTCAPRWRPCAPRSTGWSSGHGARRRATGRRWSAAAGRVDRPARAAHRQPARPLPAADRAAAARSCARAASTRCCRSRSPGTPPGAVVPRGRRVRPVVPHRRRPAGAGRGQPGRQRGRASPTARPVRVLAHVLAGRRWR